MVSYTTYMIVKLMTLWNYISSFYNNTTTKCKNLYYYCKDYIYGQNDMWVFIYGHTLPQSISNIYNKIHANWIYDNYDTTLDYITNDNVIRDSKLSWLSAKIKITDSDNPEDSHTYEIDDFIEKFTIRATDNTVPSLYIVFLCWCVYTKHWFDHSSIVKFHIIDDMGDEQVLTFKEHNYSFVNKRNKLYIDLKEETDEDCVSEKVTTGETPLKEETEKKNE